MGARYTPITVSQMRSLFQSKKGWEETGDPYDGGTKEFVYEFRPPSNRCVLIRVYSTVHVVDKVSRSVGGDAIRIVGLLTDRGDASLVKRPLYKGKRVYRTAGWEERLKQAVIEAIKTSLERARSKPWTY